MCALAHVIHVRAHTIRVCTHGIHVRVYAMCVHVCTQAYTTASVCVHTHYTHVYCEIQPHRVSCRRNWPGKSQLWHLWAAGSAWVPAANLSSEAATASSHFPGCQIPVTSDPKRDRNCSGFLRATGPYVPTTAAGMWCEEIKQGLMAMPPQSWWLPWPPLGSGPGTLGPPGKDVGLSPRSECPHYLKDSDNFPALLPNTSNSLEELSIPSSLATPPCSPRPLLL